jgi:CRP-like cAMP-binding protein
MRRSANPSIELFRTMRPFAQCATKELRVLSSRTTRYVADAGEVVIREGTVGRDFGVIVSGTATVSICGRRIASLGPGDFFGEVALLGTGRRTATVIADTELITEISDPQELAEILHAAPTLARALLAEMARRLSASNDQLERTAGMPWIADRWTA